VCALPVAVVAQFWGPLAPAVQDAYDKKQPHLARFADVLRQPAHWQQVKASVAPYLRPARAIAECLTRAGAACGAADIGCDAARVCQAILHMQEIRARTTVVDLAWLVGVLPAAAEELSVV
jgi:hypothetical protein